MDYSARYQNFRALLRQVRQEAGLTQVELARKLKKHQSFVSKSENGERRVDFIEVLEFCRACDVSTREFEKRLESDFDDCGSG